MTNEITNKLYVIIEEAKRQKFDNAIKFANSIADKKREEFSYLRSNKVEYCDWTTVREYIYFARDIKIINNDLTVPSTATFRSQVGFNAWLGATLIDYLEANNLSNRELQEASLNLINDRTLPTSEKLYESLSPVLS